MGKPVATWEYKNQDGNALGYACRFEPNGEGKQVLPYTYGERGGRGEWRWKGFQEPRPLYGLDRLNPAETERVLIVEGEKAADAGYEASGNRIPCLTWPGGCKAVQKADWTPLKDRIVYVWPDADEPGFKAAIDVAACLEAVGAKKVVVQLPPEDWPDTQDVADLDITDPNDLEKCLGELAVDVEAFKAEADKRYGPKKTSDSSVGKATTAQSQLPFSVKQDGVYFHDKDKDGNWDIKWICSPLRVAALTRGGDQKDWGRLLEIEDPDGHIHIWAMPMEMTAGNGDAYREHLLNLGLGMGAGRNARSHLHLYLTMAKPEARARCVTRGGWHDGLFVLPDKVFGSQKAEQVVLQGQTGDNLFQQNGTLDEWKDQIGRLCVDNSRLAFGVSTAFAGPLLHLTGHESGGFHFFGGSSIGKTTIIEVAGSVCGGGSMRGFIRQWRTTDNALESVAAMHSDSLLCLDELGQANSRDAGKIAYMLANGQGKGRAMKSGAVRKPYQWRLVFLSTGEGTVIDQIEAEGQRARAGQAVRVVDIPADTGSGSGAFENLHGHNGGGEIAEALKRAITTNYGTPFRAFLEHVTSDLDTAREFVKKASEMFVEQNLPSNSDGQVRRVCERFGLVAAAGELATSYGILPWPKKEALKASAACFQAWINHRGGVGSQELQAGVDQVIAFLQQHGASRFEALPSTQKRLVMNRAGYIKQVKDEECFCIFPEIFRKEVCAGYDARLVLDELDRLGFLHVQGSRRYNIRLSRKDQKKMHVIPTRIIGQAPGNDGNGGNTFKILSKKSAPSGPQGSGTEATVAQGELSDYFCSNTENGPGNTEKACDLGKITEGADATWAFDISRNSF